MNGLVIAHRVIITQRLLKSEKDQKYLTAIITISNQLQSFYRLLSFTQHGLQTILTD